MALEHNENILEIDEELLDTLRSLIEARSDDMLREQLGDLHAADAAQLVRALDEEERHYILALMPDEVVGEVMLHLPEQQRGEYLAELQPQQISDIVEELSTDDAADIVAELSEDLAEEVLQTLERSDAEATGEIRDLLQYGEDTAGGRMTTDYVAVDLSQTVSASIEIIREFVQETELEVYALYVVDGKGRLQGVVRLQDLVLRASDALVSSFMLDDVVTVAPTEDQAVVAQVMQRYDLIAVPVVDNNDELLGVITFDDIADIIGDEASQDMLFMAGITDEESPDTSPLQSIRRRIPWLALNLGTAFIASMVISQFQQTIDKVTTLAVLMPIVAGMGGNAAIQTITVMVRSLALGEIDSGNRVQAVVKELWVGLLNGLLMGMLAGTMVWLIWGKFQLGLLITVAMLANLFMAGVAGAIVPLVLRRLGFDPALSSGPLVTTVTDVTGFLTFLGLATLTLSWIMG
jgi:magnesium transporter